MDFFKSVFAAAADQHPPDHPDHHTESLEADAVATPEIPDSDYPNSPSAATPNSKRGAWSFGGLIKTIASASVIETYRRDLEEFGTGLKKETASIRDAAARAVRKLPGSLEAGASAAQVSLESVGHAIDEFGGSAWRGTAEIISQGKDALLSADSESAGGDSYYSDSSGQQNFGTPRTYSRFEGQIRGIQSDKNTFLEEPADLEDFGAWREGFRLVEEEIGKLCSENGILENMLAKLVPNAVDYNTFWARYFYKVYKLQLVEDARAKLVKRAISGEEEEELSWEVDDDEEEGTDGGAREEVKANAEEEISGSESKEEIAETSEAALAVEKKHFEKSQVENVADLSPLVPSENVESDEKLESMLNVEDPVSNSDDGMVLERKVEPVESCKDSDISVVSSQQSMAEEDDLEWDEIEDLGENDEKKGGVSSGSPDKAVLQKRLSTAEDEDLSWDIEDDEPAKP